MGLRYVRKAQGFGITQMGHASLNLGSGGGGGSGFVGGGIHGFSTSSNTMAIGGKSLRNDANPITPFNLSGKGGTWGCIINLDASEEPVWVRTFEDAAATNRVKPRGGDAVGNVVIVGGTAQNNVATVAIKDDTGTTLATISRPPVANGGWSWAAALARDTGAVLWALGNGWTVDPTISLAKCLMTKIFFGGENKDRIYATGYYRTSNVSAGGANLAVPTWGSAQVPPVVFPSGNLYMSGTWMFEIDPATGNGINALACDKFVNTATQGHQAKQPGIEFTTRGGMWDAVSNKIHFAEGHMGDSAADSGGVTIGRGQIGAFTTRDFVKWNSGGEHIRPFLARFSEDMLPEVAVTQSWDTLASSNTPGDTFVPGVLDDGSLIWATHNQQDTRARNVDRDGGGGSYGGAATPETNGFGLSIYRIPSDYGSPIWSQSLVLPSVGNFNAWNVRSFDSGSNVIVLVSRNIGANTTTASFVGSAVVNVNRFDTWVVVLNKATGVLIRKSHLLPRGFSNYSRCAEGVFVPSGPHVNTLRTVAAFGLGAGSAGIEDAAGVVQFNALNTWAAVKQPSGLGLFLSVFDAAGVVDAANCWTLASGSSETDVDDFMHVPY